MPKGLNAVLVWSNITPEERKKAVPGLFGLSYHQADTSKLTPGEWGKILDALDEVSVLELRERW